MSPPPVFGLHENANITREIQESNLLLASFLSTQSRAAGGAADGETFEQVHRTKGAPLPYLLGLYRIGK